MKLTAAARKKIPKSQFGLPEKIGKNGKNKAGKGAYPMPDKAHAINAKARATQQYEKGNLSAASRSKVNAKANKIIGKTAARGR